MKIVNLTPHDLNVIKENGEIVTIERSGEIARVGMVSERVEEIEGLPIYRTSYTEVEGLPEPEVGTIYIVSSLVLERVKGGRPDVYAPGELVRDEAGRPIGCKGLKQ